MPISVIPPHEYSHVGNPVFVDVAADNSTNTILVDIYHRGEIIYTASALANGGTQHINIAEVLQTIVGLEVCRRNNVGFIRGWFGVAANSGVSTPVITTLSPKYCPKIMMNTANQIGINNAGLYIQPNGQVQFNIGSTSNPASFEGIFSYYPV